MRGSRSACALALLLATAGAGWAQSAPAPPESGGPIALSDVAARAAELRGLLETQDAVITPPRDVQAILDGLPRQSPELQTRFEQTRARLEGNPPLSVVEQLDATWEATRAKLRGWNEVLTQWTGRVEQERTRLAGLRDSWLRSREGWAAAGAPKVVLEQIDGTVAALNATRTRVETRLSTLLLAQYRLAQLQRRADEALSRTAHARADRLHRLGRREGPALWERGVWAGAVEQSAAAARDVQGAQGALVSELTREHAPRVPLHVLLFGILLALLWRGRRAARRWNADGAAGTPPRRAPVAARRAAEGSLSWRGPGPSTLRSSAGFARAILLRGRFGGGRRGPLRRISTGSDPACTAPTCPRRCSAPGRRSAR